MSQVKVIERNDGKTELEYPLIFSLTDQFARKNSQINRSPHPPMLASSKKKIDPDVIVQGHGAKKEKQMRFGTLFFLFVNRSIFREGTQINCIYRS